MNRLFSEFAALPEVFDPEVYRSADEHRLLLSLELQQRLERNGFLRDLKDQAWRQEVSRVAQKSIAAQKLLAWLILNKRLLPAPASGGENWLDEVYKSHSMRSLDGLITGQAQALPQQNLPNASLADVHDAPWWERLLRLSGRP